LSGRRAKSFRRNGGPHGQCVFLRHGRGASGKRLFLDTQQALRGDHAASVPFTSLEPDLHHRNCNDLAGLRARWLVPMPKPLDVFGVKTVPITSSTSRPRRPAS